jgi:hypothetical protein
MLVAFREAEAFPPGHSAAPFHGETNAAPIGSYYKMTRYRPKKKTRLSATRRMKKGALTRYAEDFLYLHDIQLFGAFFVNPHRNIVLLDVSERRWIPGIGRNATFSPRWTNYLLTFRKLVFWQRLIFS